jgi:DNA polymerase beta palm
VDPIGRSVCSECVRYCSVLVSTHSFLSTVLTLLVAFCCWFLYCSMSYRRKAETCGDIDILITDARGGSVDSALPRIIQALHERDILTDDLVTVGRL